MGVVHEKDRPGTAPEKYDRVVISPWTEAMIEAHAVDHDPAFFRGRVHHHAARTHTNAASSVSPRLLSALEYSYLYSLIMV